MHNVHETRLLWKSVPEHDILRNWDILDRYVTGLKYACILCRTIYSSVAVNTDMNGKINGALVQCGCYQHPYIQKGLWCSSTVGHK